MKRLIPILLIWLACCGFTQGWQKPPLGTQLNRAHPLAQGLVGAWVMNEGSGNIINDVARNSLGVFSPNKPVWVGTGIDFENTLGDGTCINIKSPKMPTIGNKPYSLIISLKTESVNVRSNTGIFSFNILDPMWSHDNLGNIRLFDSDYKTSATPNILVLGKKTTLGWVRYSTETNGLSYYYDGKQNGVATHENALVKPTSIGIGTSRGDDDSGWEYDGVIYYVYFYDRALTPVEVSYIHANPYAMFTRPIMSRPYLNFGSGGAPAVVPQLKRTQIIIQSKSVFEQIMDTLFPMAWAER